VKTGLFKTKKMKKEYAYVLLLFSFFCTNAIAQKTITSNVEDTIEVEKSFVQIGVSFSSRALSSGRDFGVKQYIISPSINYNHKSGFYTSVTGNILSDASPAYNLTTIGLGYENSINKKWNYAIAYSRNIFNPDTVGLIKNNINTSLRFGVKYFNASLQYSYLFGNERAHRITTGANADFYKTCSRIIDNISFIPGVLVTFGTANIPFNTFSSSQFQKGTGVSWQQWKIQRLRSRLGTSTTSKEQTFGLMNIDLIAPITIDIKNVQIGINYNYAIPQKLSEEDVDEINPSNYFGISLGYTIK
jgi:hypothetical protein